MVTVLPKHGGWKLQQKFQQNSCFALETWLLENSTKSPTKLQLCFQKHGSWKNQQKVQQNSSFTPETWWLEKLAKSSPTNEYFAPETLWLENSAETPTKWLLCSRNIVVGNICKKSNKMATLLPKHGRWKSQQKSNKTVVLFPKHGRWKS